MSFLYKEKISSSPYVQTIWQTQDLSDGVYMAEADGCWDIVFITHDQKTKVLLSGPTSQPTPTPYKAGNHNVGIQFQPSTLMTHASARTMQNKVNVIPCSSDGTFELFGHTLQAPTYENSEMFIAALESRGLLAEDAVVKGVLDGEVRTLTQRSVQRHFTETTTVSPGYMRRITQARLAINLLRQHNLSIAAVAEEAGYADQAHMTRSLKQLVGLTPSEIIAADGPILTE